jgi:hypothetical protein
MPPKFLPIPEEMQSDWKKYVGSEDEFQKKVALYLDFINATYFHTPNGGSRNAIEAAKLKKMGVKAGVPDILILDRHHGFAGLAIELKVGTNNLRATQIDWLERLHKLGWLCWVSWSLDEVLSLIDWYYANCKKNFLVRKKGI